MYMIYIIVIILNEKLLNIFSSLNRFLENTNSCFAMCLLFLICVTIIIMSFNGSMVSK